jgi:outer membrane protein assembly factor BamA
MALLSTAVAAADHGTMLDAIRFVGNEVTRESVLRQELRVREGEPITPEQIEESRQAIMNLGLFKSVRAELLQEGAEHILEVRVEERYYLLPIPLLDYRPGFLADETASNYTYGGQLRFDNLQGLNQRLKLEYEKKEFVDDAEPNVRKWGLEYVYPRIVGTPYRLEFEAKREREDLIEYDSDNVYLGTVRHRYLSGRIFLSRWLHPDGYSEGWNIGGGVRGWVHRYRVQDGQSDYEDNDVVELLGRVGYYKVDQHPYHREGEAFTYSVEVAHQAYGSDSRYWRNTFQYRRYRPVKDFNANVNTRLLFGLGVGDGEAFSLGSSSSLRGIQNDTLVGDLLLLGNIEYHHRISGYQQLRGVAFLDVGNVWKEPDKLDNRRLYTSVGIGARWRVQSFVDVTLRVDYAYSTDSGESETYLSTRGSF